MSPLYGDPMPIILAGYLFYSALSELHDGRDSWDDPPQKVTLKVVVYILGGLCCVALYMF